MASDQDQYSATQDKDAGSGSILKGGLKKGKSSKQVQFNIDPEKVKKMEEEREKDAVPDIRAHNYIEEPDF